MRGRECWYVRLTGYDIQSEPKRILIEAPSEFDLLFQINIDEPPFLFVLLFQIETSPLRRQIFIDGLLPSKNFIKGTKTKQTQMFSEGKKTRKK